MYQKLILIGNLGAIRNALYPEGNPMTNFSMATAENLVIETKQPGSVLRYLENRLKPAINTCVKAPRFWLKVASIPIAVATRVSSSDRMALTEPAML